eukprot:11697905-Prorocentrum_lima.AAC.1
MNHAFHCTALGSGEVDHSSPCYTSAPAAQSCSSGTDCCGSRCAISSGTRPPLGWWTPTASWRSAPA